MAVLKVHVARMHASLCLCHVWYSLICCRALNVSALPCVAGSAAAPGSEAGGGMPWFAAAMAQAQASGLSAYGAVGFDPMSAWYSYHLGQQALAKGAPPSAAAFSNRLAGAHPVYAAARWQNMGRSRQ